MSVHKISGVGSQALARIDSDEFVKDYPWMTTKELKAKYGISKSSISQISQKLNLVKEHGLTGRFKQGHSPMNKGKKQCEYMSAEAIEKSKANRYKKGNIPGNILPVGSIRIRGNGKKGRFYKFIKLGYKNWELLHRHIWRLEHPEDDIESENLIKFKDGNPMNCHPSNLYKSDREKNMKSNTLHNLSDKYIAKLIVGKDNVSAQVECLKRPELIESVRKSIILEREINQKIKEDESR